jgi:ABC-type transport system involved in multi-copper enzyme maturation permease subunit
MGKETTLALVFVVAFMLSILLYFLDRKSKSQTYKKIYFGAFNIICNLSYITLLEYISKTWVSPDYSWVVFLIGFAVILLSIIFVPKAYNKYFNRKQVRLEELNNG